MSGKTISIAGQNGLRIPASVFGNAAPDAPDKVVPPHEAVEVPKAYGLHLIADRFAYEVASEDKADKKSKGSKPPKSEQKPNDPPDLTKLTREELVALATEKDIAVTLDMDGPAIIALLQQLPQQ